MNEEKKNYTQRGDIMARTRKAAVNLINSWVGKNEKDGSYKEAERGSGKHRESLQQPGGKVYPVV